jgi:DNA-binding transcriptional MocR family regulator
VTSHAQLAGWEPRYAARAERMRASEIRELLKLLEQPGIISFAGGIPDPALFPVAEAQAAYAAVLADPTLAGSGLQYSVSEGYYAVFFLDPDGLKLEGMVFKPPRKKKRAKR